MLEPLNGIKVLDLGHHLAGPAVGMILADLGADVVKVARPGARDAPRTGLEPVLDRGKQCVELDLRTPSGSAHARRLAASADVVVSNFRPGTMQRLGLGERELAAADDRLIVLSLPGFSEQDRERAGVRAWEGVLGAAAGIYAERGAAWTLRGAGPAYVPLPLASMFGAIFGSLAVLAALLARARDGHGDVIEVPLYNALLEGFLSYHPEQIHDLPGRYAGGLGRELARRARDGAEGTLDEESIQRLVDPLYRVYACRDDRHNFLVGMTAHQRLIRTGLATCGLWDELVAAGLPLDDPHRDSGRWEDPEAGTVYSPHSLSDAWLRGIHVQMRAALAGRTAAEWEEVAAAGGIVGSEVRSTQEWLDHAHPLAAGLLVDREDPDGGPVRQPGPIAWSPGAGDHQRLRPRTWVDPAQVAWRTPAQPRPVAVAPRTDAALDGVTVLDLTNILAGPSIGGALARFGARVVKIDPPASLCDPFITVAIVLHAGRGKESMLLDVRSEGGAEVFRRLVEKADVVLYNGLDEQLATLGIDIERLHEVNPRISLCQLSAFGGPVRGPLSSKRGFDEVLQAATGMMARASGDELELEEPILGTGPIDVGTGLIGAMAAIAALIGRERTGRGMHVATSLAAGAQLLQLPFMTSLCTSERHAALAGPSVLGDGPWQRLYEAADGWLWLGVPETAVAGVAAALGLDPDASGAVLADAVAGVVARQTTAELARQVEPAGGVVEPLATYAQVRDRHLVPHGDEPAVVRDGAAAFVRYDEHPIGHRVDVVAQRAVLFARRPVRTTPPPPKPGRDTHALLRRLGYRDAEIAALEAAGAAAASWPDHGAHLPR